MSKISEELELVLEHLVEEKMKYNYADRKQNRQWVYESFAHWLINKYQEETK